MEVTKEFLDARIAGMTQQLADLIRQEDTVRGAIGDCETLKKYLEAPTLDPSEPSDQPKPSRTLEFVLGDEGAKGKETTPEE